MRTDVGKPDAQDTGLKAIQNPQGKSRGRCDCRYPSPDKTFTPSAMAGFLLLRGDPKRLAWWWTSEAVFGRLS